MSQTKDNTITISNLKGKHFLVEKYQRGYKWGIQQVQELLSDIHDFDRSGIESFYCLQPLVVKTLSDYEFELIDGQQRLTTIFIILNSLNEKVYSISYRTRDNSETFLNEINNLPIIEEIDVASDLEKEIMPVLHRAWNDYLIQVPPEIDNVDNFHFYCAYQFIKNWLRIKKIELQYFKENLLEYTRIIWYEKFGIEDAENVFIKFNQGKIELAQAELIKALFVLQINEEKNVELRSFRLNQFAEEWNSVENHLQDDSFWFFISNDVTDDKKSNRIDLLFDLLSEKPKKSNELLYSYHKYLEQYTSRKNNKQIAELDWTKVNDLFNELFEWYNDRELFHLVGFIIYEEIQIIAEIDKLYRAVSNKNYFKAKLKKIIWDYLQKFNLDTMIYGTNNKQIETILVLHNVINYHFTDQYYRFPFNRLKLEQGWSLEHIHAQNTDHFEKIEDIRNWIEDIQKLANNYQEVERINESNLKELNNKISGIQKKLREPDIKSDNRELKALVEELDEKATGYFNKDNLNNLCLLDRKTNSSIGNRFFAEKKEIILEIDKMSLEEYNTKYNKKEKEKPFIPLASKHVFLKYFTEVGNVNMTLWGAQDRIDYLINIQSGIDHFLKSEI